jgi:hypothetical protein
MMVAACKSPTHNAANIASSKDKPGMTLVDMLSPFWQRPCIVGSAGFRNGTAQKICQAAPNPLQVAVRRRLGGQVLLSLGLQVVIEGAVLDFNQAFVFASAGMRIVLAACLGKPTLRQLRRESDTTLSASASPGRQSDQGMLEISCSVQDLLGHLVLGHLRLGKLYFPCRYLSFLLINDLLNSCDPHAACKP